MTQRLIVLFAGFVLAACTALPMEGLGAEAGPLIGGHQEFLDWNETAEVGERATLLNVTFHIWPREHMLVFEGDGSIYARCFYISLTDQQVQEIRRSRMSVNGELVDVRVELGGETHGSNVCSRDDRSQIRLISIVRQGGENTGF